MKKRVYTLYRVSTKGQVEKDDIPMQKEACRNFAESQGWEIVKEFSEKGVSGFKKSAKERDELQKIQQAVMEGKFDILLVFMFDRLGRRDDETPFIVEWFTKQGIEVWSVNEGQQRFDTHVDKSDERHPQLAGIRRKSENLCPYPDKAGTAHRGRPLYRRHRGFWLQACPPWSGEQEESGSLRPCD